MVRLGATLPSIVHDPEIMLRMLIAVLGLDDIAAQGRLPGQRQVALVGPVGVGWIRSRTFAFAWGGPPSLRSRAMVAHRIHASDLHQISRLRRSRAPRRPARPSPRLPWRRNFLAEATTGADARASGRQTAGGCPRDHRVRQPIGRDLLWKRKAAPSGRLRSANPC
jgi:hypothetical protein